MSKAQQINTTLLTEEEIIALGFLQMQEWIAEKIISESKETNSFFSSVATDLANASLEELDYQYTRLYWRANNRAQRILTLCHTGK